MKTKLVIMRPGQADETREVDLPARPSYRELDALIRPLLDGADLEQVLVYVGARPYLGDYRDMFVDGEGHAVLLRLAEDGVSAVRDRPGKALPRNEAATALYRRNVLMHEAPSDPESHPWIAGPAVFFPDRRVWF
jgi:hypothetical protein